METIAEYKDSRMTVTNENSMIVFIASRINARLRIEVLVGVGLRAGTYSI
ncbi:hypothetical protein Desti_0072 [Desulfomonile tiedjei DSM 6799]|uniref:Uncharacterized protein n=1 Tax=Desulfomonile tiedjei (strain ATCC 49306 / DSM 6799 / DCB-1) TaxID=706587 RepID=I4BZT0_DESTA|nr:hypothetical protein Desti_0072 [Desulfomonile tiedjei DSM 6799]